VALRATTRGNTFLIKHALIKRLYARFAMEKIEINYPVRKLVYAAVADNRANGHSFVASGQHGQDIEEEE
jgi:hypothetical protein